MLGMKALEMEINEFLYRCHIDIVRPSVCVCNNDFRSLDDKLKDSAGVVAIFLCPKLSFIVAIIAQQPTTSKCVECGKDWEVNFILLQLHKGKVICSAKKIMYQQSILCSYMLMFSTVRPINQ